MGNSEWYPDNWQGSEYWSVCAKFEDAISNKMGVDSFLNINHNYFMVHPINFVERALFESFPTP